MECGPKSSFTAETDYIIISDEESERDLVNTATCTRKTLASRVFAALHTKRNNAKVADYSSLSLVEKDKYCNFQNTAVPHVEGVNTSAYIQREHSTNAEFTFTAHDNVGFDHGNRIKKRQSYPRLSRTSLTCEECGKHFKSLPMKESHVSASIKCGKSTRYQITCLSCKKIFSCEEDKGAHLRISLDCNMFLKECFLSRKYLDSAKIYDDYYLNKSMCPFCLFTSDDEDVFNHVLNAKECRNKFEAAVLKFKSQSSSANVCESEQPLQSLHNTCSSDFSNLRHLRTHKRKKHDYSNKKKCESGGHLYCFFCKKYLKSKTEIEAHPCRPTRLLSRYCYAKAVWGEGEYECRFCSEKFFHNKTNLEKHMYSHDKRKSTLFQYIPSLKLDKIPPVHASGITNGSAAEVNKLCGVDTMDINNFSTTGNLYVELRDWAKASENIVMRKTITCGMCEGTFHLPDVFISHVLMKFPCLEHYENITNNSPENLNYCFKCKQKFRNNKAFMEHNCLGLVVQFFQCALCPWSSPNITKLRNHENSKHKKCMQADTSGNRLDSSDVENNHDETITYCCSPCQATFINIFEFVKHKSQFHENTSTTRSVFGSRR